MMREIDRRGFLALAGGVAIGAVAAACGDDGDDETAPTNALTPSAASPTVQTGADAAAVGVRWFGQSMFVLTSPGGTTLLLDPFGNIGYTLPPPLNTDLAAITHEHPDHNNDALAGSARVLPSERLIYVLDYE